MLRIVRPRSVERPADIEVEAFARAHTVRFDAEALGERRDTEPPTTDPPTTWPPTTEPPTTWPPLEPSDEAVHSSELSFERYETSASEDTPITPRSPWHAQIPPPLPREDS